MSVLTQGELRYINEAASARSVAARHEAMSNNTGISEEEEIRILDMEDAYRKAFTEFYIKAKENGDDRFSGEIQADFDEIYQ